MVNLLKTALNEKKDKSSSNKVHFQEWVYTAIAMHTVICIILQGSKPF